MPMQWTMRAVAATPSCDGRRENVPRAAQSLVLGGGKPYHPSPFIEMIFQPVEGVMDVSR